ncbi:uncharacterized protein LOC143572434 [Bidens hawaiensis]|uniref:uncharacterized protein LOC143572434 n=1 Tax=Bidens hawaiensis TaxID=980011 RepID=UPI00404B0C1E
MSPGKSVTTVPLGFRSTINWSFRVLILSVVLGVMIFWGINDTFNLNNDFLTKFYVKTITNLTTTGKQLNPNWVYADLQPHYSSDLLARWTAPAGDPCKDSTTEDIFIQGLDNNNNNNNNNNLDHKIELFTRDIHKYVIQTLDTSGIPRCSGGDYFETDLSGKAWKSRPPVQDFGNGSYSISLQIHPDFTGEYNLTIILLFRRYEGLKYSPERFAVNKTLRVFTIMFKNENSSVGMLEITQCNKSDYVRDVWAGRWTRHGRNDECVISNDGRYRCLRHDYPCKRPWCDGRLGSLESNGWVYSAHCSFKLFDSGSGWDCLNNRWLFFWGDSNHCDSIRNLLNFVLDYEIGTVPRVFDTNVTNPRNRSQSVRIKSVFNGHYNVTLNYQGLNSLNDFVYREFLKSYFGGKTVPDTIIMNSGLHDGVYWPNLRKFVKGARDAAEFWAGVLDGVRRRNAVAPEVVYRSTVATGGYARRLAFNPSKMEAFNGIFVDKLREFGVIDYVVDHFDMTYPWHYDNRCNDGVHYGRAPAKMRWRDGEIGHQYFVDLMLCQVLLNLMCSR